MLLCHIQIVRLFALKLVYLKHCKYFGGGDSALICFLYVVRNM